MGPWQKRWQASVQFCRNWRSLRDEGDRICRDMDEQQAEQMLERQIERLQCENEALKEEIRMLKTQDNQL